MRDLVQMLFRLMNKDIKKTEEAKNKIREVRRNEFALHREGKKMSEQETETEMIN